MNAPPQTPALPPIEELPNDPHLLREIIAQLTTRIGMLNGRVEDLQQQIAQLVRRLYGRSSEKWDPNQTVMDALLVTVLEQRPQPVTPVATPVKVQAHTRQVTPHGRGIFPETLKHEEIIIPVPEAERICPLTGRERPLIGYEETKKLDYRQAELIVKVYKREKRGSVAQAEEAGVVTAPPPEGPVPKGKLDNGLLAHLVVSKFVDHLPLYRQEMIFARLGVDLSRRTMCDNLLAAAEPLQGLAERVRQRVLANRTVHHDDSPVDLVTEGLTNERHIKEARLWVATVPREEGPWTHFQFTLSRESKHLEAFFEGYRGQVMSDDYVGYACLQEEQRLTCWAHARRKFFEAREVYPVEATEMLEHVRWLYRFEDSVGPARDNDEPRLRMRQEQAVPRLAVIKERLDAWSQRTPPKDPLGKAVAYTLNNWPRLCRYTTDARFPIDNNAAEQAIRPIALGRKNWLFLGSERGGKAAAVYMTLAATCKRAGVNPSDYFRDIFGRIMSHSTHKLDELLPGAWKPLTG